MPPLSALIDELTRSESAQAAMAMLETALARRTSEEQGAFWRAVDLYYVSRKAPPEATAAPACGDAGAGACDALTGVR